MKYYLTFLLAFSFSYLSFGDGDPGEIVGHLKKKTGETINLYKSVYIEDDDDVSFTNEQGKSTRIKGKEVVWVETPSIIYISEPDEKKKKYSLKELISVNEKYKMFITSWWTDYGRSNSIYIYDKNDNVVEYLYCSDGNMKFVKQKTEAVAGIEKYFGDCTEMISLLKKNIQGKKLFLFNEIHYTICPGSPDRAEILK